MAYAVPYAAPVQPGETGAPVVADLAEPVVADVAEDAIADVAEDVAPAIAEVPADLPASVPDAEPDMTEETAASHAETDIESDTMSGDASNAEEQYQDDLETAGMTAAFDAEDMAPEEAAADATAEHDAPAEYDEGADEAVAETIDEAVAGLEDAEAAPALPDVTAVPAEEAQEPAGFVASEAEEEWPAEEPAETPAWTAEAHGAPAEAPEEADTDRLIAATLAGLDDAQAPGGQPEFDAPEADVDAEAEEGDEDLKSLFADAEKPAPETEPVPTGAREESGTQSRPATHIAPWWWPAAQHGPEAGAGTQAPGRDRELADPRMADEADAGDDWSGNLWDEDALAVNAVPSGDVQPEVTHEAWDRLIAATDDDDAAVRPESKARTASVAHATIAAALAAARAASARRDMDADDDGEEEDIDVGDRLPEARVAHPVTDDAQTDDDEAAPAGGNVADDIDAESESVADAAYDTDDAAAAETAQEPDPQTLIAAVTRDLGETGLEPDEAARLAAELAEIEREAAPLRRRDGSGRMLLETEARADDASVERLLRKVDSEISQAEARRRQDTLTHLKAAVAATRADDATGTPRPDPKTPVLDRFRRDLADAFGARASKPARADAAAAQEAAPAELVPVPRRPEARNDIRTRRPEAPELDSLSGEASLSDVAEPIRPLRPALRTTPEGAETLSRTSDAERSAPLVLALAQRVDRGGDAGDADGGAYPVRPQRAAPAAQAGGAGADGAFAAFAARLGATELPDVLEAAAAYAVQMEGLAEFSRPQIMRRAASLGFESRSQRETALRAFGGLLREGRIIKARRGMFALPPGSRFLDEARRIAS
jgi:hypothetical protein